MKCCASFSIKSTKISKVIYQRDRRDSGQSFRNVLGFSSEEVASRFKGMCWIWSGIWGSHFGSEMTGMSLVAHSIDALHIAAIPTH